MDTETKDKTLIGPLTAEEWCSLRLGADGDPLQCCADTSDLRDALFQVLRMGGGVEWGSILHAVWSVVDAHMLNDEDDPLFAKLRAFYIDGQPKPASDREIAEMQASDPGYLSSLLDVVTDMFDMSTEEDRVVALGRVAPKVAHVLDDKERAAAVARLAEVTGLRPWHVARVVDAWRGNVGLPVIPQTEPADQEPTGATA